MIEMRQITKTWPGRESRPVLRQVDLDIRAGEAVGLTGPSGCGKSTLARILLLLEQPDHGEIRYHGTGLNAGNRRQVRAFRREVQYISQHPESFFDPAWRLKHSIMEAASIHRLDRENAVEKVRELLPALQLNEAVLERYPHQVSGGEIQRAALCRALLPDPRLLVLDEATSMLDISVQAQILTTLKTLGRERRLSFLFISHDPEVVGWFTDRSVELNQNCSGD